VVLANDILLLLLLLAVE